MDILRSMANDVLSPVLNREYTDTELATTFLPWGETVVYVSMHDPDCLLNIEKKGFPGLDARQKKAVQKAVGLIKTGQLKRY